MNKEIKKARSFKLNEQTNQPYYSSKSRKREMKAIVRRLFYIVPLIIAIIAIIYLIIKQHNMINELENGASTGEPIIAERMAEGIEYG